MKKSMLMGLGLSLALAGVGVAQKPGRGGPDGFLLKGIELTEGQRAQIAQLRKTQHDSRKARPGRAGPELDAMREARQRGDTAAVRTQMAKLREAREQKRAQHIASVRNLLTAEQRVQFDKNIAELKAREAERAQKFGERGERGRKGDRGPRGERGVGRGR